MRRRDHPSFPSEITCCFLSVLKTLLMPSEPIRALSGVNVPGFPMAGFQLTLYGRIWATPEAQASAKLKIDPDDYKSRVWVTRPRPGVDRSASAWLIRRFIDSKARFAFAPEGKVPQASVPFDMFHESGFGHRGDDCTFETLQKEFRIRHRRVKVISEIIHDADLADQKFGRREGYGIDEVLKGWARQGISDQELLDRGMQLIEGLYHSLA